MNRREYLERSGLALVGSGALRERIDDRQRTDDDPTEDEYRNPVFDRVFPDPGALRAPDGTYFAYATYHKWGDGDGDGGGNGGDRGDGPVWGDRQRPLVPILRSSNLVDWEFVGPAFEAKPDWHESVGVWAPDVARHRGEYLLYYSLSSWGDQNPGIGVASADSPAGPFEDHGKLLQSEDIGVPNSIDPCFFAEDGAPYLFWGSHRGIYGVRLAPDGRSLAGEKFQVAGEGVEAPYLVARDGRYYLFGSRGRCCEGAASDYHVVVGRADDLRGPYRNRDGEDLLDAAGTTVLEGNDAFAGPGHNAVVADDAGDDWLVYHAYERANPWVGETPRRVLLVDRLRWRDGWPTVSGGSPSRRAKRAEARRTSPMASRTAPKPSVTESSRASYRET